MKTRIISGIIGLILLAAILYMGHIALGIGIFFLSLIGMHEFYKSVENAGYKPVKAIGYLSCLSILFISLNSKFGIVDSNIDMPKLVNCFSFGIFLMILVSFLMIVFFHSKYNIINLSLTVFGVMYVVFLFSFVILTRNLEGGQFIIWLVFIGAWATDTFAYFTGLLLGKTKILPAISPKKTVEGAIGGIAGCIAVMVVYGIFVRGYINNIPLYHFIVIGILSGIISQIGDWGASAIKRYVKIKDYGSIMPGHGGVLDRFDSILFIAPVIYFYFSFII